MDAVTAPSIELHPEVEARLRAAMGVLATAKAPLIETPTPEPEVAKTQVGGDHYIRMTIQPWEYCLANGIGPVEATAIKYLSRWKRKNKLQDLEKAQHAISFLIEYVKKHGIPE